MPHIWIPPETGDIERPIIIVVLAPPPPPPPPCQLSITHNMPEMECPGHGMERLPGFWTAFLILVPQPQVNQVGRTERTLITAPSLIRAIRSQEHLPKTLHGTRAKFADTQAHFAATSIHLRLHRGRETEA